jgi:CP family cyanate transporter-like MFS transporter
MTDQRPLLVGLILCYPLGYLGLMLAPVAGAVLWAVVIGVASAVFPLALTLIGLRARTSEGTAALSGFTQSVGYLARHRSGRSAWACSTTSPGAGCCRSLRSSGSPSSSSLAGLAVARPANIEDQLRPGPLLAPI